MDYRLPITICAAKNAQNTGTLLQKKALQIGLNEKNLMTLSGGYVILDFGKELSGGVRILTYAVKGSGFVRIRSVIFGRAGFLSGLPSDDGMGKPLFRSGLESRKTNSILRAVCFGRAKSQGVSGSPRV